MHSDTPVDKPFFASVFIGMNLAKACLEEALRWCGLFGPEIWGVLKNTRFSSARLPCTPSRPTSGGRRSESLTIHGVWYYQSEASNR